MPSSKIILTKTNRPNATPHPSDLESGELAINYNDGLLFFKNNDNRISILASSKSFSQLSRHVANRENPHQVNQKDVGLEFVDNTSDADKAISDATQDALDKKVDISTLNAEYYDKNETATQIKNKFDAIDISIATPNANYPAGHLNYAKSNNLFTFTQPTIPTLSDLGGLEIDGITITQSLPAGGSGILYYQGNGQFMHDAPTIGGLGGYAKTEIGLGYKTSDVKSDGTLTYNDGFFTYDKPDIDGLTGGNITLNGANLEIAGYATDAELEALITQEQLDVTSLQSQITSNDVDIANLKSADASLQAQITSNDTDIANLTGRITSNDTDIANLTGRITSNDTDISDLSSRMNDNDTDISDLQAAINGSSAEGDITSLQGQYTNLQSQITSNDVDITSLQSQITSNDTDITSLEASVTTAENNILAAGKKITSNKNDITSLQSQISSNDTDISGLKEVDIIFSEQLSSKIGESEINTSHFTFADNTLSLNTIQEGQIGDNAVTTDKIDTGAVTTIKINDGAITNDKLSQGAPRWNENYTLTTGNIFTQGESLNVNYWGTGNRYAYVDFHAQGTAPQGTTVGTGYDYDARLIRDPGLNGKFMLTNKGTGPITVDRTIDQINTNNKSIATKEYVVANMGNVTGIWRGTQTEYEALPTKSEFVLYAIVE